MSIDPLDIRELRDKVAVFLRDVIEARLPSCFVYSDNCPSETIQYWEFEILLYLDDDSLESMLEVPCGYFTGFGRYQNRCLDTNQFFRNNDRLFDEFVCVVEAGRIDDLTPILRSVDGREYDGVRASASLVLNSYAATDSEWERATLEEPILILHTDDDDPESLRFGCQQNERKRIRLPSDTGEVIISVPYDKIRCFSNCRVMEGEFMHDFKYDVALSFSGKDRVYARRLANEMKSRGIRVFFDEYEQARLWGKDLYSHLSSVYSEKARFCVLLLSCHYKDSLWTNHERENAQARAFEERSEYILPIKIDDTEIPGIRKTIGYVHKSQFTVRKVVDLIVDKLKTT